MNNYNFIETYLELDLGGDSVTYPVLVTFDYMPEERGNMSGHPDTWTVTIPEYIEITEVKLQVSDNIFSTLDQEYITGGIKYKLLEDIRTHIEEEEREYHG